MQTSSENKTKQNKKGGGGGDGSSLEQFIQNSGYENYCQWTLALQFHSDFPYTTAFFALVFT